MPTEISAAIAGTWFEVGPGSFRPVCEAAAMDRSRAAISRFPDFPFTYYALAYCLERSKNPEWRRFATTAVKIFEGTTSINGHQKSHDECLAYLRQELARAN